MKCVCMGGNKPQQTNKYSFSSSSAEWQTCKLNCLLLINMSMAWKWNNTRWTKAERQTKTTKDKRINKGAAWNLLIYQIFKQICLDYNSDLITGERETKNSTHRLGSVKGKQQDSLKTMWPCWSSNFIFEVTEGVCVTQINETDDVYS